MRSIAEARGISIARVALAYVLAKPFVTTALPPEYPGRMIEFQGARQAGTQPNASGAAR